MTRFRFHLILWSSLAGLVLLGWLIVGLFKSDIDRVKLRTSELLASLEKNGPESIPVAASRVVKIMSYIAPRADFELDYPFPARMHRQEIASLLQSARTRADQITIKTLGMEGIAREDGSVEIQLTVQLDIDIHQTSDQMVGAYRLIWVRNDDAWQLISASALEVIQHPDKIGLPI